MARPRTPHRTGRLVTVLGSALPEPDDAQTEPLPVVRPDPPPGGRRWVRAGLVGLLPASWRGARVDPGRAGATALALVAAAAAVVAAVGVWSGRPQAEPVAGPLPVVTVSNPDPTQDPVVTGTAGPPEAVGPLVVSVSGKVARPGLVEVPAGARVADVLDAAGGALPGTDLTGLNLARKVADGEQVAVGVPAAPDALPAEGSPPGGTGTGGPDGPVDLNTATAEQLDTLPGVGPVTVERILDWRTRNGGFARVEQLREIEGIGEARFGRLRELVTV